MRFSQQQPLEQVGLLKRLAELTKPSGLLVLVGKEPEEIRAGSACSTFLGGVLLGTLVGRKETM